MPNTPRPTTPAVLLGGHETALPVARSLGRAGIPVYAVGGADHPLRRSRFCAGYTVVEPGAGMIDGWLRWLRTDAPRGVLIAVSDDGLELVVRHRAELVELGYRLTEQRDDVVLAMLDKRRTYEIADAAGVPRPWTAYVDAGGADLGDVPFPCGVKPVSTHRFQALTGIREKVLVARTPQELEVILERTAGRGAEVMVTELIPGPATRLWSHLTYRDEAGRQLFEVGVRKIRQEPARFGVASYARAEPDEAIAAVARRFLDAAEVIGPAQVEFKVDDRDGLPKLMECNHRISLLVQLVRASGVDLPLIVYRRALGDQTDPACRVRHGARLWHPLPDLRAMRELHEAGELGRSAWALSLLHRQHFTVWAPSDPMPTLADTADVLARVGRRLVPGR
jgi:predicted ATP-grasp superfamily ATP-dependent carboligase